MRKFMALSFGDMKNISLDSMLLLSVFVPFILAFVMRLGLPFARGVLLRELSFDISQYYILIMSVLILITPMMIGMLSGFLLSFFVFYFIGIVECRVELLIPVLLLCALESPMMALFLGAFASNKVEGLALTKAFGILFLAPVDGYFIKSNWQYAAGIAPSYWVSKALLASVGMSGSYWVFVVVGAAVHLLIIALLIRRFENLYI
ncbi:MAG: hypothetical protein ACYCYE_08005 [Clostridia bacterium]